MISSQKNAILISALSIIAIILLVMLIISFQNVKKIELSFNEKKAILVKENIDTKEKLESTERQLNEKSESVDAIEQEKKRYENDLEQYENKVKIKLISITKKLETISRHKAALKKKITSLKKISLESFMNEEIKRTDNNNIKMILEDSLKKMEMVYSGKSVNLEPIVVMKEKGAKTSAGMAETAINAVMAEESSADDINKTGKVVKFDGSENCVVVDLGRIDGVEAGDKCRIFKNEQEIGSGDVISVRYRISAAFIDNIKPNYTVADIEKGLRVSIEKKME